MAQADGTVSNFVSPLCLYGSYKGVGALHRFQECFYG